MNLTRSPTKLEDDVHCFAYIRFRQRKLWHRSHGEVRFAGLRIPTVQPYKNIHILFDLYLYFSRKLNIKEGILLLNLETGK